MTMRRTRFPAVRTAVCAVAIVLLLAAAGTRASPSPAEQARTILEESGVAGGLVVHVGSGDGRLTAERALVQAGETLFVAGPPDLVDEVEAFRQIDDPAMQARLGEQAASIAGEKGAALLAVSAADGEVLSRLELENPPVFDGMAAAKGRLYLSTADGAVLCLSGAD